MHEWIEVGNELVHVDRHGSHRLTAGDCEQRLRDGRAALHGIRGLRYEAVQLWIVGHGRLALHHLEVTLGDEEQVVEVVGKTSGEDADGLHALRLSRAHGYFTAFGDVNELHEDEVVLSCIGDEVGQDFVDTHGLRVVGARHGDRGGVRMALPSAPDEFHGLVAARLVAAYEWGVEEASASRGTERVGIADEHPILGVDHRCPTGSAFECSSKQGLPVLTVRVATGPVVGQLQNDAERSETANDLDQREQPPRGGRCPELLPTSDDEVECKGVNRHGCRGANRTVVGARYGLEDLEGSLKRRLCRCGPEL